MKDRVEGMKAQTVSVIIPTRNRPDEAIRCLESLSHQTYSRILTDGSLDPDYRRGLIPQLI